MALPSAFRRHPRRSVGKHAARVVSLLARRRRLPRRVACVDRRFPDRQRQPVADLRPVRGRRCAPQPGGPAARVRPHGSSPKGVVLVVSLNPWSPAQLRWLKPPASSSRIASNGRRRSRPGSGAAQFLGAPSGRRQAAPVDPRQRGLADGFRAARLTVMRRREGHAHALAQRRHCRQSAPGDERRLSRRKMKQVEIHTDGACLGNPGTGRLGGAVCATAVPSASWPAASRHHQQPHGTDGRDHGAGSAEVAVRGRRCTPIPSM
jgi:hypothetical protein